MTYDGDWRDTFRPDIPSVARIYDYLLGGKDNYPADRAVGESMIAQLPNVRQAVQWNRAFLRRVVRYLIREACIKQIIDVPFPRPRDLMTLSASPEFGRLKLAIWQVLEDEVTRARAEEET